MPLHNGLAHLPLERVGLNGLQLHYQRMTAADPRRRRSGEAIDIGLYIGE
jgi:hypothetical protein